MNDAQNQPWLDQTPRGAGLMAAQRLDHSVENNPFPEATEAYREWHRGFTDSRTLLHMQNSRNLALGRGLVLLYQVAPERTREALIHMGKKSGELLCLTILAAMLEAEHTRYDLDDPELVLVIYSAMKQRMSDKKLVCHLPDYQPLAERCFIVSSALLAIFRRLDRGTIQLDVNALTNLLHAFIELDVETQRKIRSGEWHKPFTEAPSATEDPSATEAPAPQPPTDPEG